MDYTETYAETLADRVGRVAAAAKDEVEKVREFVTDSSEVADAVDNALQAIGLVELAAETVIERRTQGQ